MFGSFGPAIAGQVQLQAPQQLYYRWRHNNNIGDILRLELVKSLFRSD